MNYSSQFVGPPVPQSMILFFLWRMDFLHSHVCANGVKLLERPKWSALTGKWTCLVAYPRIPLHEGFSESMLCIVELAIHPFGEDENGRVWGKIKNS